MDKQTEALIYANVIQVIANMGAAGVRDFTKKYGEHISRGDYVEAVQFLEQVNCALNLPAMYPAGKPVPTAPPPPSVRELAYITGCRIDAPLNVVAEAALKRLAELKEQLARVSKSLFEERCEPRNKYDREILPNVHVDVYDVLHAFEVWQPELQHAIKKLLAPGKHGDKSLLQDLKEAQASIEAAVRREDQKN